MDSDGDYPRRDYYRRKVAEQAETIARLEAERDALRERIEAAKEAGEIHHAKAKSFRGGQSANVLAQHQARIEGMTSMYRVMCEALAEGGDDE